MSHSTWLDLVKELITKNGTLNINGSPNDSHIRKIETFLFFNLHRWSSHSSFVESQKGIRQSSSLKKASVCDEAIIIVAFLWNYHVKFSSK